MSEITRLTLSHGAIHTVLVNGQPHVVLKPAIEDLGLDYRTQLRKLKSRSWATVGSAPTVAEDGKTREMTTVPPRTFLMLLATINEQRVAYLNRKTLVAFQNETADAIEAYWIKGAATNPRAAEAIRPTTVTWDHAAAVARLHHGLNVDAHSFKELLTTGGILTTKNGIPHRRWEHLFWPSPSGSRWEIHASVLPQLIVFAAKIRRELAAAERSLQMSLPFPIAGLVRDAIEGGAL